MFVAIRNWRAMDHRSTCQFPFECRRTPSSRWSDASEGEVVRSPIGLEIGYLAHSSLPTRPLGCLWGLDQKKDRTRPSPRELVNMNTPKDRLLHYFDCPICTLPRQPSLPMRCSRLVPKHRLWRDKHHRPRLPWIQSYRCCKRRMKLSQ